MSKYNFSNQLNGLVKCPRLRHPEAIQRLVEKIRGTEAGHKFRIKCDFQKTPEPITNDDAFNSPGRVLRKNVGVAPSLVIHLNDEKRQAKIDAHNRTARQRRRHNIVVKVPDIANFITHEANETEREATVKKLWPWKADIECSICKAKAKLPALRRFMAGRC